MALLENFVELINYLMFYTFEFLRRVTTSIHSDLGILAGPLASILVSSLLVLPLLFVLPDSITIPRLPRRHFVPRVPGVLLASVHYCLSRKTSSTPSTTNCSTPHQDGGAPCCEPFSSSSQLIATPPSHDLNPTTKFSIKVRRQGDTLWRWVHLSHHRSCRTLHTLQHAISSKLRIPQLQPQAPQQQPLPLEIGSSSSICSNSSCSSSSSNCSTSSSSNCELVASSAPAGFLLIQLPDEVVVEDDEDVGALEQGSRVEVRPV